MESTHLLQNPTNLNAVTPGVRYTAVKCPCPDLHDTYAVNRVSLTIVMTFRVATVLPTLALQLPPVYPGPDDGLDRKNGW